MARPVVRGTFSPSGPRRPAVVARLARTLGAQPISSCGAHANSRIQALTLSQRLCLRTVGVSRRPTSVPCRPALSLSVNNSQPTSLAFPAALHRPSQAGSRSRLTGTVGVTAVCGSLAARLRDPLLSLFVQQQSAASLAFPAAPPRSSTAGSLTARRQRRRHHRRWLAYCSASSTSAA